MNIEQISESRCHITISTEIKINLKRIGKHCDNCFCRCKILPEMSIPPGNRPAQSICDNHLFD